MTRTGDVAPSCQAPRMATWEQFSAEAPELAAAVRERLDAHKHKTIATLRADGSPRISGIEVTFLGVELYAGSMPGAVKARDLQRDGRFALHSGSDDSDESRPDAWEGDGKIAGRAVEVTDEAELAAFTAAVGAMPPGPFHLFRLDLTEVVHVRIGDPADHLVITSWHAGRGVTSVRRT